MINMHNLAITSNISQSEYLPFRDSNGELNYREIVNFLDLDKNAVSKIAGVSKQSVRYDHKIPKEVREHLNQISNICQLVAEFFDGDPEKTSLWFSTPNPMLGDVSPRDMLRFGRYKKLLKFILNARKESGSGKERTT